MKEKEKTTRKLNVKRRRDDDQEWGDGTVTKNKENQQMGVEGKGSGWVAKE